MISSFSKKFFVPSFSGLLFAALLGGESQVLAMDNIEEKNLKKTSSKKEINLDSIFESIIEVEEGKDEKPVQQYDEKKEYRAHQKAHTKFFKKEPKKEETRKRLEKFKEDYENYQNTKKEPEVILDKLSSRSRILLFRSISEEVRKKKNSTVYFPEQKIKRKPTKGKFKKQKPKNKKSIAIQYKFGELDFSIQYSPTKDQPSNIWAKGLPDYKEVHDILYQFREAGLNVEESFFHKINLLFDLEIARRVPEESGLYDTLPVGSAIARFGKHIIIKENPRLLFKTDDIDYTTRHF